MNTASLREELLSLTDFLVSLKSSATWGEFTDLVCNRTFGRPMVDDFGDTLPFLAYVGRQFNPQYFDLACREARTLVNTYQMPSGLFYTSASPHTLPRHTNFKVFNADKMSDTALGVNLFYDLTHDPFYLDAAARFFSGLRRYHCDRRGFIHYLSFHGLTVPFSSGKFCGLYIEELVNTYGFTHRQSYLDFAKQLAHPWLANSFFKAHNLFPFVCPSALFRPVINALFTYHTRYSLDTVMSSKSNTNLITGILALYRATKHPSLAHALRQWVHAVEKNLVTPSGVLYTMWSPSARERVYLGCDHPVISALIDISQTLRYPPALSLACSVTDAWLVHQTDRGIIPQGIFSEHISFASDLLVKDPLASKLDTQTDFGILLFKLYELTEKPRYLTAAYNLLEGVISCHKYNRGYVDYVNTRNGKHYGYTIETKYLFLLLKLFVVALNEKKGKPIYKNPLLESLIRDR